MPGIGVARALGATTVEIDIRFNRSNFAVALLERPAAGFLRTGDSLRAMGAVAYAVPVGEVRSAAFVDYYHAYGLLVSTWSTDRAALDVPANWAKVTGFGVDLLTTDRPDEALAAQRNGC